MPKARTRVSKSHVKVGDMVFVLSGKDKKKRGRIVALSASEKKALVSGINKVKKHLKARRIGDDSGIVEVEAPIRTDKLQVVCPNCDSPTRVGHELNQKNIKVRVCKKCKKQFAK